MKQTGFFQTAWLLIRFMVLKIADAVMHPFGGLPELDFNALYDPGIL